MGMLLRRHHDIPTDNNEKQVEIASKPVEVVDKVENTEEKVSTKTFGRRKKDN